ncbi:DUF2493 domain-containing protein [Sphingomonas sp. H39-1-10]|uniref:DUF2493 domain-containing protein n=1 Tax=Sphingomonas pollutisoli TaxID=3030829 RepID=UPI0023B8CC7C|nr:DUF2493 domain-containing protein [Sphingomonas pollutisoli]MDF0490441.1 DUF2493 domain-containing protein [Sphingomonas pollutisoli]
MARTKPKSFSSFTDLAEVYASLTSAENFASSFTETVIESRLSIMSEPTEAEMPDAHTARLCVEEIISAIFRLTNDTRLEEYAQSLAWGFVNSFHVVADRINRTEDRAAQELGDLARRFDPSEVYQTQVEEKQQICQSLAEARASIETMRRHAEAIYAAEAGRPFNTTRGSKTGGALSASQIEAIDWLKAREAAKHFEHNPKGVNVLVSGGAWEDVDMVFQLLDGIKARYPNMVLHTGAQWTGIEQIGTEWAAKRGVDTVLWRLKKSLGKRAGFYRNDRWERTEFAEAVIGENSYVQVDLARKLRANNIPLHILRKREQNGGRGPLTVSETRAEGRHFTDRDREPLIVPDQPREWRGTATPFEQGEDAPFGNMGSRY